MRSRIRQLVVLAFALTFTPAAYGAGALSAVISGYHTSGCYLLPFATYSPSAEWVFLPGSPTIERFAGDIHTIASADGENIYGILTTGRPGLRIVRVLLGEPPRYNARQDFFDGLPGYYGSTLAVAKNGRVLARVGVAGALNARLAVISSAGSLERLLDLPASAQEIAVAADSCTVYYADGIFIRRLNACSGAPLPTFATLPAPLTDLAVLSTGHVLVLTNQALMELDEDGKPVRTFTPRDLDLFTDDLSAVSVSPDETVIGIAVTRSCEHTGRIIALALTDGRELWRQETSYINTATGLVIGPGAAASIPALSGAAMLLLAGALALLGAAIVRR